VGLWQHAQSALRTSRARWRLRIRWPSPLLVGCGALALLATAVSLYLRSLVPLEVGGSSYDEGLYVRQATALSQGDWLGPFNKVTLSKNPSYAGFVAAMHQIGLPLKIGEHLTYLLAAAAFAGCVWISTRRPGLTTAAYVILALRPESFARLDASVLRDGWYASLGLLFVSLTFIAATAAVSRRRRWWFVIPAALAGFVGALFILCREEGMSLFPAIAVIVLGVPLVAALQHRRETRRAESPADEQAVQAAPSDGAPRDSPRRLVTRRLVRPVLRYAVLLVVFGVALVAPIRTVEYENQQHYGVALTNDQTTGTFARAFADWSRVRAGSRQTRRPISYAQREAVYDVSPAAAQLRPWLDLQRNAWLPPGCTVPQVRDGDCDFSGGPLIWAMRDAAVSTGHYATATDLQTYFSQIDRDINRACSAGRLRCDTRLPISLQPLTQLQLGPFIDEIWSQSQLVLFDGDFTDLGGRLVPRPRDFVATRAIVVGMPANPATLRTQLADLHAKAGIFTTIGTVYRFLFPASLVLGLVGVGVASIRPRGRGRRMAVVLGLALLVGIGVRLAAIAVVDTVEFTVYGDRYEMLTRLLAQSFGLLGSLLLLDRFWPRVRQPSTSTVETPPAEAEPPRPVTSDEVAPPPAETAAPVSPAA
jgi:hypothetical protein